MSMILRDIRFPVREATITGYMIDPDWLKKYGKNENHALAWEVVVEMKEKPFRKFSNITMNFEIETERLRLRDVREDDLPVVIAQYAEKSARNAVLSSQLDEEYNRKQFENALGWAKHYGSQRQRPFYQLTVERKADNAVIGSVSMRNVVPKGFETNIGWHFSEKYKGQGYATEAARALLYIGFGINGVGAIYADCFDDNRASMRVMEKIGMKPYLDYKLFNTLRGWGYGELRPSVRHFISKRRWSG